MGCRIRNSNRGKGKYFSLFKNVQNDSGELPTFHQTGTGFFYRGQSGRSLKLNTDLHPMLGLRMCPTVLTLHTLRLHDVDKDKFSSLVFTESH